MEDVEIAEEVSLVEAVGDVDTFVPSHLEPSSKAAVRSSRGRYFTALDTNRQTP